MAWALQSPANRQPYPPLTTTSAPLVGLRAERSDAADAPAKKPLPGYQLAPALTDGCRFPMSMPRVTLLVVTPASNCQSSLMAAAGAERTASVTSTAQHRIRRGKVAAPRQGADKGRRNSIWFVHVPVDWGR